MKLAGLIFDFDMTLVDSLSAGTLAIDDLRLNHSLSAASLSPREIWGNSYESFAKKLKELNDTELSWEEIQQLGIGYINERSRSLTISHPDTLQLLRQRGLQLGIVTNATRTAVLPILSRSTIADLFQIMLFMEDARYGSDKTERISRIINSWEVEPEQVAYIGDHPNDILAAKASGAKAIAITTGLVNREEFTVYQPNLIIDSLTDLAKVVSYSA